MAMGYDEGSRGRVPSRLTNSECIASSAFISMTESMGIEGRTADSDFGHVSFTHRGTEGKPLELPESDFLH